MFRISANAVIDGKTIKKYIELHKKDLAGLNKLQDYYSGKHDICNRVKDADLANNKLVCNHAKYITDTATGYLIGNPVSYESKSKKTDLTKLNDWLDLADSMTQDVDLALMVSKFGKACELVYMSDKDSPTPLLASVDPRNAFVVYDDTVKSQPVFAVYYIPKFDDGGKEKGYTGTAYTKEKVIEFTSENGGEPVFNDESPNNFGDIPLTEYWNNGDCQADFEQVISLIDAYNILQSDRVNDKQQFVEAVLLLYGAMLGDTDAEKRETYKALKEFKALELPEDAKAEYIQKAFDENSVEVLRKAIESDIHKFSGVPAMSDENFAGNASGVAMRYKLLGFEQITKIKERYFKEGLKNRLKLFIAMMKVKAMSPIDINDIKITFTRSLPSNDGETATMIMQLQDAVSDKTLISQLSFVEDADAEVKAVKQQKAENMEYQNQLFKNTKPTEDVVNDENG